MNILGVSAFCHDSAAALLIDYRICAAAQEERFTRVTRSSYFPRILSGCRSDINLEKIDMEDFFAIHEILKVTH